MKSAAYQFLTDLKFNEMLTVSVRKFQIANAYKRIVYNVDCSTRNDWFI